MRKTKRFTPTVLDRFERQGRGTGIYTDFLPWHQVSRGDPSSNGRSHLLLWRNRFRELLSDGELSQQLFAIMQPDLDDSLEQYMLSPEPSPHPLARYGVRDPFQLYPGTLEIAKGLGIKHPVVRGGGRTVNWKATTDLVNILRPTEGALRVLAMAFKTNDWHKHRRTVELLRLEREFWLARGVPWLLITPSLSDQMTVSTLQRTACWALSDEVSLEWRGAAVQVARSDPFSSQTQILRSIGNVTGSLPAAQAALWQAIWFGDLPVDLRCSWRPYHPFKFISNSEFSELNPVVSRRSAWI